MRDRHNSPPDHTNKKYTHVNAYIHFEIYIYDDYTHIYDDDDYDDGQRGMTGIICVYTVQNMRTIIAVLCHNSRAHPLLLLL